jgi:hypothetical protein
MAPVLGVRHHRHVATGEAALSDASRGGAAIDGAFGSQRNPSEKARDWRAATEISYHSARSFEGDAPMGLSGRADRMEWPGSGNNVGQGIYGSPHSSNDTAADRTASILCAEYNLCIDYNPSAPRFGDWQGNLAPLDGSYLTTKQFGWSYGDVLLANASTSPNAGAGDSALIPPNPSFSDAVDRSSGLISSAAAQSPATSGKSGLVSVGVTGAVSDFYQTTNARALAGSISSEDNSGKIDPALSGGVIVLPRATPPTSIRRSAVSSSSSTGNDSGSAGNSAGTGDINQGSASVNVWPVVTFGTASDDPESDPWPLEFHTSDPVYAFPVVSSDPLPAVDPLAPVPEPSQIVLMLTVIALVGLVAKRSAGKHGILIRAGRTASY